MKIQRESDPSEEKIKVYLQEFAEIRESRKELEKEEKWRQEDVVAFMKDAGRKTITTDFDGTQDVKGTLVQATRVNIDEEKLKKTLGAEKFNKITKRVLDKDKLEEAIAEGEIDPNEVAQASEEKTSEYIRVSFQKKDPEED